MALERIKSILGIKEKKVLPYSIRKDDIFIVSFPKSGNTWVRFLLCNYFSSDFVDFGNSNLLIPDVHLNPNQINNIPTTPRFIKSHMAFNKDYNRVVYIIRDGRDVAVSYYYYQIWAREISDTLTFKEYFFNYFMTKGSGFGGWGEHIALWKNNKKKDILLIRYEDLKTDLRKEFIRILEFSGLNKDQAKIEHAVTQSSFDSMKDAESQSHKLIYEERKMKKTGYGFMRKGITGDWKTHFDEEMLAAFNHRYSGIMQELGYSD